VTPQGGGEVMVKQATTIYDTIYLHDEDGDVTWCQDRLADDDLEYRLVGQRVVPASEVMHDNGD
jgi:hypothetical protein